MPQKKPAPVEEVTATPEAPAAKPKAPRRRTKAAAEPKDATALAAPKPRRRRPVAKSSIRAQSAVVKLEQAVDQLEGALKDPSDDLSLAAPPAPVTPSFAPEPAAPLLAPLAAAPKPAVAAEAVHMSDGGWRVAAPPLLASGVFLALIGALIIGYSTGHSVGSGSMEAPGFGVAEASERTAQVAEPAIETTPVAAAEPAPAPQLPAEPKPAVEGPAVEAPAVAQAGPASGLHLQVSALRSRRAADELSRRLESEGFPVRLREPGDDNLVRVLVGPAADRHQLDAWSSRLRQEGLDPFPKTL